MIATRPGLSGLRWAFFLALTGCAAFSTACDRGEPSFYPGEPPSIVLIVVDTLRSDHLGHNGYSLETSPSIDRLAAEGRVFSRAVAASPWTGPSVASIVTGRYPDELGLRDLDDPLPKAATTLAERFRDHGWTTAAIVSNGYIAPWFGQDQGYDQFDLEEYLGDEEGSTTPVATADRVTDRVVEWLRDASGPYFLYVHFTDPHEPYLPPTEWKDKFTLGLEVDDALMRNRLFARTRLLRQEVAEIERRYDASIAFADDEIGRLIDALPDDVLIVLTGDHGEEFLDHGGYLHGHTVFEELIHVPLIFRGPGIEPGQSRDLVSHVDVAPTLLAYAGVLQLPDPTGQSLLRPLAGGRLEDAGRAIFSVREYGGSKTVSAQREDWKLIQHGQGAHGLFNLADDPGETTDLSEGQPDIVRKLAYEIAARRRRVQEAPPLDSEELERRRLQELRSLGYID